MSVPPRQNFHPSSGYHRRAFGKSLLAGAVVGGSLLTKDKTLAARENLWQDSGIKLGVSHQYPRKLTPGHLAYLKQMGVEYLELRLPAADSTFEELARLKGLVEDAGLRVFEIMLSDAYNSPAVALGLPERDQAIREFQDFLRRLGRLGIDATTYAWHTGGAYRTGYTETRGSKTRQFELQQALALENKYDREYTEEDLWKNYGYFIERVLPVAEDEGVRLQLHPNDPPIEHQGVARIFRSVAAFRRAMDIADHSPYSGILFCTGTFGEMAGADGQGEDVAAAIREFGGQGHIFQVHYRNVSSPLPNFHETFPDNGYLHMPTLMKALAEIGFQGIVCPDHVPQPQNSNAAGTNAAEAFIFGYIRAMIQAFNEDPSPS